MSMTIFFFLILGFLVEHIEYYNPKLGEKKEGKKKKKTSRANKYFTLDRLNFIFKVGNHLKCLSVRSNSPTQRPLNQHPVFQFISTPRIKVSGIQILL